MTLSVFPQAGRPTFCCRPCLLSMDLDFHFLREKVGGGRQGNPSLASLKLPVPSEEPSA